MTNREQKTAGNEWDFSVDEQLLLHQLEAKEYWVNRADETHLPKGSTATGTTVGNVVPKQWSLLQGLLLYDWQQDCVDSWFAACKRGTVKVVTGAGKTVLALGLIERLQNEEDPDLRVAIVVPTIVLMNQWYEEIITRGNLPASAIGRLGGGYNEDFGDGRRILLSVLNSASAKLAGIVEKSGHSQNLLLVVDECHRAGSAVMSRVFTTARSYNLGLSATPEREGDAPESGESQDSGATAQSVSPDLEYNQSLLGSELGPIICHMTVEEAFERGILPPYEIRHYGLPLTPQEKIKYERLSRSIKEARQELSGIASARGISAGSSFNRWCRKVARQEGNLSRLANQFLADTARRKRLLYQASARKQAVIKLLQNELKENPQTRAILFHESIEDAMDLWRTLVEAGLPAVPENSELPLSLRETSLDLFRRGTGQILVSVKSLVEGFNVPATDIGLIVASSTSPRQRIQTIGRVLRKHRTAQGEEKNAVIQVLYIDDTVDDLIYAKTDWGRLTGAERNVYFKWDPLNGTLPEEQPGPPSRPLPSDLEVNASILEPGQIYPGAYEGYEYTADTSGNVYLVGEKTQFANNPQGIPLQIERVKGNAGRFKITPNKQYVLVRVPKGDEWQTLYVTTMTESFHMAADDKTADVPTIDAAGLKPGDQFTGPVEKDAPRYGYKHVRGRPVITKKSGRGEAYARTTDKASNPQRGRTAEEMLQSLATAEQVLESKISSFVITGEGFALVPIHGQWIYIGQATTPFEFPGE